MIKLDPANVTRQATEYLNEMMNVIKRNYQVERITPSPAMNPFTGRRVAELFESGGTLDETLLDTLLTGTFSDMTSRYMDLQDYIQTCRLVYYSSFKIHYELDKLRLPKTQRERERFRERYATRYASSWFDQIKAAHPNYMQNDEYFDAFIDAVEANLNTLNEGIGRIVNYSMLPDELRHSIMNRMGVEVCPYCNRQYITHYHDGIKFKTTADLDHFYPKSVFMLLSLSLFNFVPSCHICNSRCKLAKGVEILYPYDRGYMDDALFKYVLTPGGSIDSIVGGNTDFDIEMEISGTGASHRMMQNGVDMFKLEKLYRSHKECVREILYKKQAYSKLHQDDLQDLLELMGLEQLTQHEMNLFQYGYTLDPENFSKRPLSKLAYDVIRQILN
ncbi:hypothetical protein [Paenibacillus contaminans]|uniref:HNH nuclease domain-containing protein n=1 Tax=Paenibacillus contaminans TaxID=450362 RepID=A0A329LMM8_9BACL|nr:hypothetical protein [Paenibacillus contaminans]RAV08728.1 hypothetical protein DQG23_40655 [Paenibacillus contaminans]